MKLHYFLFTTMLVGGAWISNYKASSQQRAPASVQELPACERHVGGFSYCRKSEIIYINPIK
jgi:hypothetical protein